MRGGRRGGRGEASDEGEANKSIWWRDVGPTAHVRDRDTHDARASPHSDVGVRWWITRLVSRSTGTLYQLTRHALAGVVSRQFAHRTMRYV